MYMCALWENWSQYSLCEFTEVSQPKLEITLVYYYCGLWKFSLLSAYFTKNKETCLLSILIIFSQGTIIKCVVQFHGGGLYNQNLGFTVAHWAHKAHTQHTVVCLLCSVINGKNRVQLCQATGWFIMSFVSFSDWLTVNDWLSIDWMFSVLSYCLIHDNMCVLKLSDEGGGVARNDIDRLFQYMYSTAPKPPLPDDINTAPLVCRLISVLPGLPVWV